MSFPGAKCFQGRGDHGAGVTEWTPAGVCQFCRGRSRSRSRNFE